MKYNKIAITGGSNGFLGRHVTAELKKRGYTDKELYPFGHHQYDLTKRQSVENFYHAIKPDVVIHCAALCGGITANMRRPLDFYYYNALMGQYLIWEGLLYNGLRKFVNLGTICSYGAEPPRIPFMEEDFWSDYPDSSNAAYGIAKKSVMVMGNAARAQHGLNFITLLPVNLYGVGDCLDIQKNHVVPALCMKFLEAKRDGLPFVKCLGDGSATREFLFVEDCAQGIANALEYYDGEIPINLGSGEEISILSLAETISHLVGYDGDIIWEPKAPNGQKRRVLNTCKARKLFGFRATTPFKNGLQKTIAWIKQEKNL